MLAVSETRRGLVEAKIDALRAEGELIANILAEGAAESIEESGAAVVEEMEEGAAEVEIRP